MLSLFLFELNFEEKIAFLELAHRIASVDDCLTPAKEILLEEYAAEMYIEEYKIQHMPMEEALSYFQSERSKHIALIELLRLIFSDGVYRPGERKSIQLIKEYFKFDPNEYNSFRDWITKIKELQEQGS
ncbi:hypothetical protein [Ammoniphilus sp. 3BR4]|uniref:hypothetical protein n=1 Tax=Ammoniphilus sp. 3BR4 TaxID=3158265 RepID=UPI003466DE51